MHELVRVLLCVDIKYVDVSVYDNRCLCVFIPLSRMNSTVKYCENTQHAIIIKLTLTQPAHQCFC